MNVLYLRVCVCVSSMFVRMDEGVIAKMETLHPFALYTLLDNIQHTLCMHTVVSRANLTSWSVQTAMGSKPRSVKLQY